MTMATLERAILAGAKNTFKNPKLKMKDILEWSTGNVNAEDREVVAWVKDPGVNVAILKSNDKR
jgi:hypothetical protein